MAVLERGVGLGRYVNQQIGLNVTWSFGTESNNEIVVTCKIRNLSGQTSSGPQLVVILLMSDLVGTVHATEPTSPTTIGTGSMIADFESPTGNDQGFMALSDVDGDLVFTVKQTATVTYRLALCSGGVIVSHSPALAFA